MKLNRLYNFFSSRKQDYQQVFSGPAGKRVLADLLRECQPQLNPVVANDVISSGVNIGRQLVARLIQFNLNMPESEMLRLANIREELVQDVTEEPEIPSERDYT